MTAPTSLAETLCRGAHPTRWEVRSRILPPCDECARSAVAARAWLVTRLADDDVRDAVMVATNHARGSGLSVTEAALAALTEALTDD